MGLEGTIGGSNIYVSTDSHKISVSQAARLHSGSVKIEGIISGISKLKKIIKSQDYECGECGNVMKFTPTIEFENQKPNLADDRPYLYQPMMKTPDKCSNVDCNSNKHGRLTYNHLLPRREYINAIVIELRDLETFSDIDPLKVVLFDDDTKDVHAHLGQKVTITGNIRVITFPRKDTVSHLYAETIMYESSQEVIITAHDKAAFEKLVLAAKRRKLNVLEILGSMFAPEIIGNDIIKQGMLLCAASTNTDETQKKIQVLIIGDPGLGKSAMLRKSIELVPNSRYESAENSSGKSLTAIVEKDDESHILRTGPIPAAKGAICALNELGRMFFEDQKHLLGVMQEQFFTINKHGISARIHSPTAIIASANPTAGEWKDPARIDLDEIPAIKPLIDRFDLIFVTRNVRNEQWLRNYAAKKLDLYCRKRIPDHTQYLRKYIEYSKRFDPELSIEAEHMLKEYYINVALQYGSPRLLESVTIIAKMIARLKLKNIIDADDAYEAQQFFNVILQQLQQVVNIVTNPSDEAYVTCI
jgi:DNA replicative helicase MCM subunit Mcm2 (Cdc46/Mcm family)